jgi:hypothetical protein
MTVPHQRSPDYAILAKADVFEKFLARGAANTLRAFNANRQIDGVGGEPKEQV